MTTLYIKILFIISVAFLSCTGQKADLKRLCADIRNTPQMVFPNKGQDKKIKLIRQLKNFRTDETCDSLKSIFVSVDTSNRGYWDYKYETLYILSEFNTKKSLLVLSEIIRDYPLDDPSNMFFIWDLVSKTENISVMLPNITQSLEKQKWTDGHILIMIISANQKGHLTREQLEGSKNDLIAFYDYLKIEKDSLPGSKHYEEYYDAHLTDLLICLRIFEPSDKINTIYRDALNLNSDFAKFCTLGSAEYNNKSKRKITAMFQAVLGLIQNNQGVDEKYIELVAAEPLYHNAFYEEFVKLKKQSLFPKRYLGKELFAISDLALKKENTRDESLPDCLDYLDKRQITEGKNKGVYYFYNARWNDEENQINLEVSGPQPLELAEFVLKGTLTNKIYTERFTNDKVQIEIDKVIRKLSE
jgi:hypothetical protein